MKTINQVRGFSKERFWQVVKRFCILNLKKWLIGFAGGAGILLIVFLLTSIENIINSTPPPTSIAGVGVVGLGLILYKFGGYFLTSGIFNELGKKGKASQMLTFPASTFEKFLAGWFLTYFLYTVVVMSLLYIIGLILGVNPILTTLQFSDSTVDASNFYFLDTVLTFTAMHSVFFLGSIYFNGNNFLKTLLAIVLFFIGLGITTTLIWIFYSGTASDVVQIQTTLELEPSTTAFYGAFFKIVIAALFLFLSYRQLQNRQIA